MWLDFHREFEEEANTSYTVQCEGAFPAPQCGTVSVEPSSWGAIKALFGE